MLFSEVFEKMAKSTVTKISQHQLCMPEVPYLFDRIDWSARIEQVKILDA